MGQLATAKNAKALRPEAFTSRAVGPEFGRYSSGTPFSPVVTSAINNGENKCPIDLTAEFLMAASNAA